MGDSCYESESGTKARVRPEQEPPLSAVAFDLSPRCERSSTRGFGSVLRSGQRRSKTCSSNAAWRSRARWEWGVFSPSPTSRWTIPQSVEWERAGARATRFGFLSPKAVALILAFSPKEFFRKWKIVCGEKGPEDVVVGITSVGDSSGD